MYNNICCFAGHSKLYENIDLENVLYAKCEELILKESVKCFWVENYGSFDRLSARIIRKLKEIYPEIKLELIVPYITKEINDNRESYYKNYDSIILDDIYEKTPARYKILKCNQYRVNC